MAPHLVKQGIDLHVIVLHDRPTYEPELAACGVVVHHARGNRRHEWLPSLVRELRAIGPNLVHTTLFDSDVLGRIAARTLGFPVVTSWVNVQYGSEHRQ